MKSNLYDGFAVIIIAVGLTSGGYWTSTSTVKLNASLYTHGSKKAIWTGDITVTEPKYVDQASNAIAHCIYSDARDSL